MAADSILASYRDTGVASGARVQAEPPSTHCHHSNTSLTPMFQFFSFNAGLYCGYERNGVTVNVSHHHFAHYHIGEMRIDSWYLTR